MSLIQGLHGVVALIVLCSLLFAEEAGVPLPVPGELMLVSAGVLIGTGGLDPWLYLPLAIACCFAGTLTGFGWARLVGEHGLRAAAERFHQTRHLDKVSARLRQAGAREVAISRLIPGLRVYTSLVAGAAGVDRQRFMLGAGPAIVAWVILFTLIGAVVGVPAERLLGQLEALIVQGGVLIVAGVGGYVAIRRTPEGGRVVLMRLPFRLRVAFALAVDMGLIAAVVAGVLAIVRPLLRLGDLAGWADVLLVVAVIGVFYSIATRRGRHATAGETLLGSSYLTQPTHDPVVRGSLRRRLRTVLHGTEEPDPTLGVELFRALSDPHRLRVVRHLAVQARSAAELAEQDPRLSVDDASCALQELEAIGVVASKPGSEDSRYGLADDHLRLGLAEFLAHLTTGPGADEELKSIISWGRVAGGDRE